MCLLLPTFTIGTAKDAVKAIIPLKENIKENIA